MKRILFLLCWLCVPLALTACGSDEEQKAEVAPGQSAPDATSAQHAAAPEKVEPAPAPPVPQPTPEEMRRASGLMAFYNAASTALGEGWYAVPDALLNSVHAYQKDWRLAPLPAVRVARQEAARRLAPPTELFSKEDETLLTGRIATMNSALDAMLKDYKALEKYVKDDSIKDDGVKGKKLAASLAASHASFMVARAEYLDVLEKAALPQQDVLLHDHPLQRQISGAEMIFHDFRVAARELAPEKPDRERLENLRMQIEARIAAAGQPPFPASPELERAYRAFLKDAARFPQGLERGLAEGFYSPLRRELNAMVSDCRKAYNVFARLVNEQ